MKKEDLNLVSEFMKSRNISLINTRAFKNDNGKFFVTIGSVDTSKNEKNIPFKGHTFNLVYGEFGNYLKEVNINLKRAQNYASNDHQRKMLQLYQQHFKFGDIEDHKNSQREWI